MKPMSGKVSAKRHLAKTVTWRLIASGTTFVLALIFFGTDEKAVEKASMVAVFETVIKMLFYYMHERAWYRVSWGVVKDDSDKRLSAESREAPSAD